MTRTAPVLLFLAGDIAPEAAGPAGRERYERLLERLERMGHVSVVALAPLADGALLSALEELDLPTDVVRRVVDRAHGNPAVVNALLQQWHEGLSLDQLPEQLPETLGPALLTRWKQTSDEQRDLVRRVVRADGEIPLDSLASASGLSRLALRSRLRALENRHSWLRVVGERVKLTQPFVAALPAIQEPSD